MLVPSLADLGVPIWEALLVSVLGVATVGFVHFVVRSWRGRQQMSLALPAPAEVAAGSANSAAVRALAPRRSPPPPERRSSLRRRGNPVAVLVANSQASTQPWDGWVLDRSSGGLRLAVPAPIAVGTLLKVRTTHDPECAPWVQLRVRRCRQRDAVWVLGCQFVQMPPLNVLLLFG